MPHLGPFNTEEVRLWNNPQPQTAKTTNFAEKYVAPHQVAAGLNSLDIKSGTVPRAKGYADEIDAQKCTMHADTCADTTLYMAGMGFLIKKPGDLDIQIGEFNTEEDHPLGQPKPLTSRCINFQSPYVTPPKVIVFLNMIDAVGCSVRIKAYASNIDAKGFTIHIDPWADTTIWRAKAGWVAYPEYKSHIFSGTARTLDLRPWGGSGQIIDVHHQPVSVPMPSPAPVDYPTKPTEGISIIDTQVTVGKGEHGHHDTVIVQDSTVGSSTTTTSTTGTSGKVQAGLGFAAYVGVGLGAGLAAGKIISHAHEPALPSVSIPTPPVPHLGGSISTSTSSTGVLTGSFDSRTTHGTSSSSTTSSSTTVIPRPAPVPVQSSHIGFGGQVTGNISTSVSTSNTDVKQTSAHQDSTQVTVTSSGGSGQ
ncbi:hypothetical protein FRC04_006058 [Tulasnella sp. 424]|nr:hypothetical protein FRC04_006058 [Tulasnella sp. 424]KAG8962986.1 hypothetical protein FRC05_004971 [Tulasnella sp. 425]